MRGTRPGCGVCLVKKTSASQTKVAPSAPVTSSVVHRRRLLPHPPWYTAPLFRTPHRHNVVPVDWPRNSLLDSQPVECGRLTVLFQLHWLVATLNRACSGFSNNELRPAFSAHVTFAHLIRHGRFPRCVFCVCHIASLLQGREEGNEVIGIGLT